MDLEDKLIVNSSQGCGLLNVEDNVQNCEITETGADLSESTKQFFKVMNYPMLGSICALFGTVGNLLTIAVFIKQGFSDSINISLMALALSDLCVVLTFGWLAVVYNPLLEHADIMIFSSNAHIYIAGWSSVMFNKLTSWLTVYITFERCLCIVLPFKVKTLLTPRRTLIILVFIFLTIALVFSIKFWATYVGWGFDQTFKRTMLVLLFSTHRERYDDAVYFCVSFLQFASFIAVVLFTTMLIRGLKQQTQWRNESSSAKQDSGSVSLKERRVISMVVLISSAFIAFSTPALVLLFAALAVPDLNVGRCYQNFHFVAWTFCNLLACVNSSINVIIYIKMSSSFRANMALLCARFTRGTKK